MDEVKHLILKKKININAVNEFGETSLHLSAISNAESEGRILRFLLEHSAEVNKQTNYKYEGHDVVVRRSPLHWYVYSCDVVGVRELLRYGADPLLVTEEEENSIDIVQKLIKVTSEDHLLQRCREVLRLMKEETESKGERDNLL